ncbi:uncharacterized protein [Clytia hemisphaerica]|uniref:Cnidarian restricted protein n=1 Tax=Clytia hemisphaerica TaxID=252671 RepID=A0A7M6DMW1_9CNID
MKISSRRSETNNKDGLIILFICLVCCQQNITGAVDVQAKSSCAIDSKLTLKVDNKELVQPQRGLYVLVLNTTNGKYKNKSFDQPMKSYFWDIWESSKRKKNKLNFIKYIQNFPNNTVIVFVSKGLCKYSQFGDWISFLEEDTDLVFEEKDYRGDWMSAIVVACKTNCPKNIRPISVYGQHATLNVTFSVKGDENVLVPAKSDENEITKIIIIVCVAAIIILLVAISTFLLYQRLHSNRNKQNNQDGEPISEENGQAYEDAEYERIGSVTSTSQTNIPTSQQYTDLKRMHSQQSNTSNTYQGLQLPESNSEYKSLETFRFNSQHSNASITYTDLTPASIERGQQSPSAPDNIYSSIETPTDEALPGTSFNLFKRSMENIDQDPKDINKNNFSSYVKMDCENPNSKTKIYKKPSSVPKFQPPVNDDMVIPDIYENSGCNAVMEPVYETV